MWGWPKRQTDQQTDMGHGEWGNLSCGTERTICDLSLKMAQTLLFFFFHTFHSTLFFNMPLDVNVILTFWHFVISSFDGWVGVERSDFPWWNSFFIFLGNRTDSSISTSTSTPHLIFDGDETVDCTFIYPDPRFGGRTKGRVIGTGMPTCSKQFLWYSWVSVWQMAQPMPIHEE